jgi:hypothetical protein
VGDGRVFSQIGCRSGCGDVVDAFSHGLRGLAGKTCKYIGADLMVLEPGLPEMLDRSIEVLAIELPIQAPVHCVISGFES